MTARILLIRHGAHDLLGRMLCGRMAGVGLNEMGLAQAGRLAATLAGQAQVVLSSPLLRTRQTAEPIAAAAGLPVVVDPGLDEIDMGGWSGTAFETLDADPAWRRWNSDRLHHRPPDGESMLEAQARIGSRLQILAKTHFAQCIVAVSHADVIKAAVCQALSLSLDHYARFDVDPGTITTLLAGEWGMKLTGLNYSPA